MTQHVRISSRYDDNDVPYVRLTRTVQSGFGLGIGIALAQVAIFGAIGLLVLAFGLLG